MANPLKTFGFDSNIAHARINLANRYNRFQIFRNHKERFRLLVERNYLFRACRRDERKKPKTKRKQANAHTSTRKPLKPNKNEI